MGFIVGRKTEPQFAGFSLSYVFTVAVCGIDPAGECEEIEDFSS